MIVTILGGSAHSTPWLIDWLARQTSEREWTIRLAGRNRERLQAVQRASEVLAAGSSVRVEAYQFDEWAHALSCADVVILQVRVGGYEGREFDESFSLRHGIPGDEGLGPGGLSAALRAWPELKQICRLIQSCAPGALPILLTSPGSLLVRCAARTFPGWPLYAICELPTTTFADVCRLTGQAPEQASFHYAGVNHLGWLFDIESQGVGLLPRYLAHLGVPLRDIVRVWHAVPLKYARLHFYPRVVVREQLASLPNSRSRQLQVAQRLSFSAFERGCAADIRQALARRPAVWYPSAIGPFLQALAGGDLTGPFFLSRAEPDGEVQERPFEVRAGYPQAIQQPEPPDRIREFVRRFQRFEKTAVAVVDDPTLDGLSEALALHPWVPDRAMARNLGRAILQQPHRQSEEAGLEQSWRAFA